MKKIFMVTALHLTPVKKEVKHKKTAAWFETFKEAENCVLSNENNLFQFGKFEIVVIEEIPNGIYNFAKENWYEAVYSYATQELESVLTTPKPVALKNKRNFTMVDR